ncbi:MAG TPA: glycosyltransferase family 2 protein [Synechococcales cyanobacterium M55_K2018_004]|nr:glycosyltransferase family 2 protein [Synechococcales cyanobacterium M55_K2018_004]
MPASGVCPPFSIVIPVYNEEEAIAQTLDDLQGVLKQVASPYEVVVVDDGSSDRTGEILSRRSDIRLIQHTANRGYGAALKTGIRAARYPIIAITDADGTYPNEQLPHLVMLSKDVDMVVGARIGEKVTYSNLRKIPKWFLVQFAQWVTQETIPDLNSGMRVLRKAVVQKFLAILPDTFSFTTTITIAMLTNGYKVRYEPINYYYRTGKSKIKPIRDTLRFVQIILRTGVYFAPLRVFLPVAGLFFLGGVLTLLQDIFIRDDITDRTLILLVTATQLAMFALLADMIDKRNTRF